MARLAGSDVEVHGRMRFGSGSLKLNDSRLTGSEVDVEVERAPDYTVMRTARGQDAEGELF